MELLANLRRSESEIDIIYVMFLRYHRTRQIAMHTFESLKYIPFVPVFAGDAFIISTSVSLDGVLTGDIGQGMA